MKRSIVRLLVIAFVSVVGVAAVALACSRDPAYRLRAWWALGRYERHDPLIREIAAKHGVDPLLVKAIVWHESEFDPTKVHDGARGLMQIGEGTGIEWAAIHGTESFMPTDLLDPHTNLNAGCWYLGRVLARWSQRDDAIPFALAEYHIGPEAVERWAGAAHSAADFLRTIDSSATREFVTSVSHRRQSYIAP